MTEVEFRCRRNLLEVMVFHLVRGEIVIICRIPLAGWLHWISVDEKVLIVRGLFIIVGSKTKDENSEQGFNTWPCFDAWVRRLSHVGSTATIER